jgi:5-formyltetrahydrofolate cyclo-ligase
MCPDYRAEAADVLRELVLHLPDPAISTLALHVSVGFEPSTRPLLAALREAGTRVLLPVVLADLSLDWALYAGPDEMSPGPRGIPEPTGPRLGPGAIGQADLVLLPGLLADRAGNRLGRGGGSYDRALPLRRAGVPAFVLLYPMEVVDALPAEPHDAPVNGALTPDGLVPMGR